MFLSVCNNNFPILFNFFVKQNFSIKFLGLKKRKIGARRKIKFCPDLAQTRICIRFRRCYEYIKKIAQKNVDNKFSTPVLMVFFSYVSEDSKKKN